LLNTSFNLKGEPIVNTPREAFETFRRSGMDVLVLGDYVVEKSSMN
jgi:carbamoyltransferase